MEQRIRPRTQQSRNSRRAYLKRRRRQDLTIKAIIFVVLIASVIGGAFLIKKFGPSKEVVSVDKYYGIEINGKNFRFEYDNRYTITGKSWYDDDRYHGFSFKLFDNKLNKQVTSKYNYDGSDETFYIEDNEDYVNFGPVKRFIDTTIPFEIKEWEKKNRPGFFKRVFKRG